MNLAFDERGNGEPVLFIAGRGGAGRTRHLHQVPAFQRAGFRCITFDNRGIGATENAIGFSTDQVVADTASLITKVVGGGRATAPCISSRPSIRRPTNNALPVTGKCWKTSCGLPHPRE